MSWPTSADPMNRANSTAPLPPSDHDAFSQRTRVLVHRVAPSLGALAFSRLNSAQAGRLARRRRALEAVEKVVTAQSAAQSAAKRGMAVARRWRRQQAGSRQASGGGQDQRPASPTGPASVTRTGPPEPLEPVRFSRLDRLTPRLHLGGSTSPVPAHRPVVKCRSRRRVCHGRLLVISHALRSYGGAVRGLASSMWLRYEDELLVPRK